MFSFIFILEIISFFLVNPKFNPGYASEKIYTEEELEDKTVWHDCSFLEIDGKGWANTESFYDRLPAKAKDTVRDCVWKLSHLPSGICVRFMTDAKSIKVRWAFYELAPVPPHVSDTAVNGIDLYTKDESGYWWFVDNGRPKDILNETTFNLDDNKEYLLYLPVGNRVKSIEIGIPENSTISKPQEPSLKLHKPIIFYGTSITQGACASRPGMTWTAIVGRHLNVSVINLGFSGEGKMEPEIADLLVELDPSIYVLDCLANMDTKMISARVEPFVKKLRAAHPFTPILLLENANFRNIRPTPEGKILRKIYKKLITQGIRNLHFLSNNGMLGEDGEGTVDRLHPNDLGMMRMATVLVEKLSSILQTSEQRHVAESQTF